MPSDSIAALRGVLKEQPQAHGRRKAALKKISFCFLFSQATLKVLPAKLLGADMAWVELPVEDSNAYTHLRFLSGNNGFANMAEVARTCPPCRWLGIRFGLRATQT